MRLHLDREQASGSDEDGVDVPAAGTNVVDRQMSVILELSEQLAHVLLACRPAPPPLDHRYDKTIENYYPRKQKQLQRDDSIPRQAAHKHGKAGRRHHRRQSKQCQPSLPAGHLAGVLASAASGHGKPIDAYDVGLELSPFVQGRSRARGAIWRGGARGPDGSPDTLTRSHDRDVRSGLLGAALVAGAA